MRSRVKFCRVWISSIQLSKVGIQCSQQAQPSQTQPSPSLTASYIQLDNRQPNPQDSAHHLEKDKPVKQAQEISINQTTYNQTPATPRLQVVTYPKLNQIQTTNQSATIIVDACWYNQGRSYQIWSGEAEIKSVSGRGRQNSAPLLYWTRPS